MNLSSETLMFLKNFQAINTNLILHPGNTLYTQNNSKSIFAMVGIKETIPQLVHIYDLPSLLGVLSLSDAPEIEFTDTHLAIVNKNGGTFDYYYSAPNVVFGPPAKEPKLQDVYGFDLSKEDISLIMKASGIIGATTLSVKTQDDDVVMSLADPKSSTSNAYRKIVGKNKGLDFDIRMDVTSLKIIPDDYSVSLTSK